MKIDLSKRYFLLRAEALSQRAKRMLDILKDYLVRRVLELEEKIRIAAAKLMKVLKKVDENKSAPVDPVDNAPQWSESFRIVLSWV